MRISLPARNEYGTDVWNLRRHTNYLPITDKICQSQKCKSHHIIANFFHSELQKGRKKQIMPQRYVSITLLQKYKNNLPLPGVREALCVTHPSENDIT
jgi:hypothetical protein